MSQETQFTDDASIQAFSDSAADFLGAADQRARIRTLEPHTPGFERAMWSRIAGQGWLSILVPEQAGGLGLGLAEMAAVSEQVGRHLLAEPFIDAGVHPIALLAALPESPARDRLLAQLQSGEILSGVAWQQHAGETEAGANGVTAEPEGDALRLTGAKRFVRPGVGVDGWLVTAMVEGEAALLWVAAGSAGLSVAEAELVDGSRVAELVFASVRVPAGQLLAHGESVLQALLRANETTRIAQAAELTGIARRALELTQEYVRTRVQFGRPIGSFQALQHRLVDGYIQIELASAALQDGLAALTRGDASLSAVASRVKARSTHAALTMTRTAIQLHGAIGYTYECDVGFYFRRAMALGSRLGGATLHRQRHARLALAAVDSAGSAGSIGLADSTSRDAAEAQQSAAVARSGAPVETQREFPRDADWDAMPESAFRQMVRAFIVQNYPSHLRHKPYRAHWGEIKEWYFTLSRQGWIAPAWPKQYGGMALPPDKLIAFIEEHEQYGVARPPDQGVIMLGPILIRFGTDAQRATYLPKILAGEHVWCQGYSEPNAGSDLASLRCEAKLDGEVFVVNGQKTWTTLAQDATHMFMLVRTAGGGKKQEGISFLLVDLTTPGVTVRPIRNIAGDAEFCEVFFDNVRVPCANLVGELHQGWNIAKALLGFERIFGGSPKHAQYTLAQLDALARQRHLFDDPAFVARFAEAQLDTADLCAVYAVFAGLVKRGETLPASVSLLKVWATETHERIALLLAESAAEYGGYREPARNDEINLHVVPPLFNALAATIFSGTNEIQRNILAKQVLGLPT